MQTNHDDLFWDELFFVLRDDPRQRDALLDLMLAIRKREQASTILNGVFALKATLLPRRQAYLTAELDAWLANNIICSIIDHQTGERLDAIPLAFGACCFDCLCRCCLHYFSEVLASRYPWDFTPGFLLSFVEDCTEPVDVSELNLTTILELE